MFFCKRKVLFLFLSLLLMLSSCSDAVPRRKVLMLALRADPVSLNPVLASEMPSIIVNQWIFNGLVRLDENLQPVPDLAESWDISPDGKVWTFHLREDVTWHDGHPFTAEDVKFTVDAIVDPATNTYNRGLFVIDDIPVSAKVIDKYTVEIELPGPFAPLLTNFSVVGIIPAHILKGQDINTSSFNSSPVGTGAFKFKNWHSGEIITLTANENYYRGKVMLEEVVYRIIPGEEGRLIALETEQIDIGPVPVKDYKRISGFENLTVYRWYDLCYYYLGLDLTNPLFQDKALRQALNYAVNRQEIVDSVLMGHGKVATGPIPYPSWAYSSNVKKYDYNPEKASEILSNLGWKMGKDGILVKDGKKLSFTIHYGQGSRSSEKASVYIQHFLKKVGVEVRVRPVEFSVLVTEIANPGKFEGILLDWIENPDPDCFVEWGSHQVKEGMNFMSYSNPSVDEILKEARTTPDMEERKKMYEEFQQILVEDAPYVFLWYSESMMGVNRRVTGISKPNPAGLFLEPEKIDIRME
ncbi:hypothetical protein C4588_02405 [Candidatus Parcubacteria bacterium]|nr:MAG: hypothetical protein C4588_02405 [Candidatus Parcubacteria bacterium]